MLLYNGPLLCGFNVAVNGQHKMVGDIGAAQHGHVVRYRNASVEGQKFTQRPSSKW